MYIFVYKLEEYDVLSSDNLMAEFPHAEFKDAYFYLDCRDMYYYQVNRGEAQLRKINI